MQMLSVVVAQLSSDSIAIRYVLPVSWTTSCIAHNVYIVLYYCMLPIKVNKFVQWS